jgi:putative tryptophan/tyrosine transport system substrate-binding protein
VRRSIAASFAFLAAVAAEAPRAQQAALVLSEPDGAYAEVAEAIRRKLPARTTAILDAEAAARGRLRAAVAIGTQACANLAQGAIEAPLLCVLIPRESFERIASSAAPARARTMSALPLDQPLSRQMALIRAAFPERTRVVALLGPDSGAQSAALTAAAERHGLRLATARIATPEEIHSGLQRLLPEGEVLLAVPDSVVFNATNVQNILRTSFRSRVPLVGFSAAYARAGAVLALYSTPAQLGEQAGQWLADTLDGRPTQRSQSPQLYEVAINRHVARSLGLELDGEKAIADRMRLLEERR